MASILASQVVHTAGYEPPGFVLLARGPDLAAAVFRSLKEFGATASQIKPEGTWQPPDQTLLCHLLDYEASVRYRVDTVEVFTKAMPRAEAGEVARILEAALRALLELDATLQVRQQFVDISAHIDLSGVTVEKGLAQHLAPTTSHNYRPVSLRLRRDLPSHEGGAMVELERSYIYKGDDKLFAHVRADFPSTIPFAKAFAPSVRLFHDVLTQLGLKPH